MDFDSSSVRVLAFTNIASKCKNTSDLRRFFTRYVYSKLYLTKTLSKVSITGMISNAWPVERSTSLQLVYFLHLTYDRELSVHAQSLRDNMHCSRLVKLRRHARILRLECATDEHVGWTSSQNSRRRRFRFFSLQIYAESPGKVVGQVKSELTVDQ